MLHHLLPDEVAPGSLVPNLDFYEPRTAHGSSLSPAIHAALLARAGRYRPALEALRIAARHRSRRPDRQHRRRPAPGDDGRALAGARLRLRRHPTPRRRARSSIRDCRRSGTRSSSRCASADGRSGSASTAAASRADAGRLAVRKQHDHWEVTATMKKTHRRARQQPRRQVRACIRAARSPRCSARGRGRCTCR